MDVNQEQKSIAWTLVNGKLDELNQDEMAALAYLCLAYVNEADDSHLVRQRKAIEGLLGPLNLGEWMVLGPVLRQRVKLQVIEELHENTEGRV